MRKKLATAVPGLAIYNSFDIVGDIAIIKLPDASAENGQAVAKAIMDRHRGIKTVLAQTSAVTGDYRLRRLTCIGGENKTQTAHREHGCTYAVDVESCYFSPRLSNERLRIAKLVQPTETVVNMFAGVGCFSILISRQVPSAKVYSIDINPAAFAFMQENVRMNRVFSKVVPLLGDSQRIIETKLQGCADRVLMPLPEKAIEYLPSALTALKRSGGWIHMHLLEHATKFENPSYKIKAKLEEPHCSLGVSFNVVSVKTIRSTGPNWFQLVADVQVS